MSNEDYPVAPRSDDEIEALALLIRIELGTANDLRPDLLKIVELASRSGRLRGLKIEVRADDQMLGQEAFALSETRTIVLCQSTYDAAKRRVPRAGMTLAHEIGHILMHPGAPKQRMARGNITPDYIESHKSAERQARVFAGAFLMLRAHVLSVASVDELAKACNVSRQAAEIRWQHVMKRATGKQTPPDIAKEIEARKARYVQPSRQADDRQARLLRVQRETQDAWDRADVIEGEDQDIFRKCSLGYRVRRDEYLRMTVFGWKVEHGRVVAYYPTCGR